MHELIKNFSEKDITYTLYGLFLGDGYYNGGWLYNCHTNKQKFYCEWLESLFKDSGLTVSSKYDYDKKTTFGVYKYSHVNIKVPERSYFEACNRCFDNNGHKIVSSYVLDNINPLGLLLWFLDDGQFHVSLRKNRCSRFGYLNTQSFSLKENEMIRDMFKDRFGIQLKIHKDCSGFKKYKDKIYYRLYFNAENFRKFFDVVRQYLCYIPKEFYYKFDMKYYPNRTYKNVVLSEKYNLTAS